MPVGQNLINKPSDDLRYTIAQTNREDKARSQSKSVLNLADVLSRDKTAVAAALKEINDNQASWAEQLTPQRLNQFALAVKHLQSDYRKNGLTGGVTPNTIINRSRNIDIQRASQEIHTVQAVRFEKDGIIKFRTNASDKHGATHHIVTVQFLNFQAALNGGKLTNKMLDDYMKSAVKFDCDCKRHRYWYRYIATVGGFAYGKPETAFPKIRNPELTGMACKHVIRVMHTLARNPAALRGAIKMHLSRFRADPNQAAKTLSKKQAYKIKIIAPKGKAILRITQKVQDSVQAAMQTKANNINAITLKRELAKLDKRVENGELNFKQYQQARDAMFKMLEKAA